MSTFPQGQNSLQLLWRKTFFMNNNDVDDDLLHQCKVSVFHGKRNKIILQIYFGKLMLWVKENGYVWELEVGHIHN